MKIEAIAAPEAEKTIIGSLLDDPRRLSEVSHLSADDFFVPVHRIAWEAIRALDAAGKWRELDVRGAFLAVWDEIVRSGEAGKFASEMDLVTWVQASSVAPLRRLADQIRAKRRRVQLAQIGRKLVALSDDVSEDEDEAMARALEGMALVADGRSTLQRVGEWDRYPEELEARAAERAGGKRRSRGVPTYLEPVDRDLWRGFRAGNLYVFAGRPGDGKSSFLRQMLLGHVANGGAALVFNGEMSREETRDALYPTMTGISSTRLDEGDVDYGDFRNKVHPAWARLQSQDLSISGDVELETIESVATQWALSRVKSCTREDRLPIVAVDYMQLLRLKQRTWRMDSVSVMKEISRRLKLLAMRLQVPVVSLSRLNRTGSKSEEPDMHDLAEAGSVEFDASVVGMIQVERNMDRSPTGRARLRLLKQRGGPVGEVELSWDPRTYTFGDPNGEE